MEEELPSTIISAGKAICKIGQCSIAEEAKLLKLSWENDKRCYHVTVMTVKTGRGLPYMLDIAGHAAGEWRPVVAALGVPWSGVSSRQPSGII